MGRRPMASANPLHTSMSVPSRDDPVWQTALGWVMRAHEQPLDEATSAELRAWLDADPAHREAHRQASYLWQITGCVPPSSI